MNPFGSKEQAPMHGEQVGGNGGNKNKEEPHLRRLGFEPSGVLVVVAGVGAG